jgi:uncharacterized membrane protein YraQ (UPF0718 family)
MRKFIFGIIQTLCIILLIGVVFHYRQLHQDNEMLEANHPKEIGKSAGKTAKKMKDTFYKVKDSEELKELKDNFNEEYSK